MIGSGVEVLKSDTQPKESKAVREFPCRRKAMIRFWLDLEFNWEALLGPPVGEVSDQISINT